MTDDWRPERPWTCPGGRRVLKYTAPNSEWLAFRRGLLGASDVAKVLGVSEHGDAYKVWAVKTGRAPDDESSPYTERGRLFEKPILDLWSTFYRTEPIEYHRKGLMQSLDWQHAGASVDWLSICPIGRCVIEVKSAADMRGYDEDEVPVDVQFQTAWQLYVTGRDHAHVVALGPRFNPVERLIERDDVLIERMVETLRPWWVTHVERDWPPDPTRRSIPLLRRMYAGEPGKRHEIPIDLAVRLDELRAAATQTKQQLDDLVATVMAEAGDATEIVAEDGKPVATWRPGQRVDGADKAWRASHPELAEEYGVRRVVHDVDTTALVRDHPELLGRGLTRRRPWTWSTRTPKEET
jgi:putative phage-type endonuclease